MVAIRIPPNTQVRWTTARRPQQTVAVSSLSSWPYTTTLATSYDELNEDQTVARRPCRRVMRLSNGAWPSTRATATRWNSTIAPGVVAMTSKSFSSYCTIVTLTRTRNSSSAAAVTSSDNDDEDDHHQNNDRNKVVVPFLLADIGEGIREVEVLQWHVKVGDVVQEFDTICQVQSDKATVDITSRFAGKIVQISPDTTILVGQPLVHIETFAADDAMTTPSSTTATIKAPQSATAMTTPTTTTTTTSATGTAASPLPEHEPETLTPGRDGGVGTTKYLASPAVRKLAADHNIDLSTVKGTGPQGIVLKGDILQHVAGVTSSPTFSQKAQSSSQPPKQQQGSSPVDAVSDGKRIVTLSGYNRSMVQSMTESLQIPHMALGDEIVVDKLIQFRNEWNSNIASSSNPDEEGATSSAVKLGMQTLLIKACSLALKEFPSVNAKVHNVDLCQVCYHDDHDIGVAMDTPHGLVVPVIRNVQTKSLVELQHDLNRLKRAAATGRTALSDLVPSPTFTLSNIGAIGVGTHMSPVLVPPMIAMGALGRIQRLPRFVSGDTTSDDGKDLPSSSSVAMDRVVPTHILYVSWAADHRFLDGATLARFHQAFAKYASNPLQMLPLLT